MCLPLIPCSVCMHSWWGGTMYSTVSGGELVKTMHLYQVMTSQSWHDRYSIKTQGWVDQTVFLWFTSVLWVLWVMNTLRCSGTVDQTHKGICSVQSCSNYLQTSPGDPGKPAETPDDKALVKWKLTQERNTFTWREMVYYNVSVYECQKFSLVDWTS